LVASKQAAVRRDLQRSRTTVSVDIVSADLTRPKHAQALIELLSTYALDPMGGGKGLTDEVKSRLPGALSARPGIHVFLALAGDTTAGLAVCMEGFSTFACKPLINIHDLVVAPAFRRQGISTRLLQTAEELARATGCCKLTLEVLDGNAAAKAAYARFGFRGYELNPDRGKAMFWEKKLNPL